MSAPCPVPGCDLAATEWTVCRSCASRLAKELAAVPGLAAQAELTLARQGACAGHSGPRSTTVALAYDPRASAALGTLKAVLVGWVRDLAEDDDSVAWPADTVAGCSAWLLERVGTLRTHPAGGDVADEVHRASVACWRAIDRPPSMWFAGPCNECGTALYARPDALGVSCWACGTAYDVEERRGQLRAELDGMNLPVRQIARMAAWLGDDPDTARTEARVNLWVHRGQILRAGKTMDGTATYSFREVVEKLHARRQVQAG